MNRLMMDHDESAKMRGVQVLSRWRCPLCGHWIKEPIRRYCQGCRTKRGEVIEVSRKVEGAQYFNDLTSPEDPLEGFERALDMLDAVQRFLEECEDNAIEEDLAEPGLTRVITAVKTVSKAYETVKKLTAREHQ